MALAATHPKRQALLRSLFRKKKKNYFYLEEEKEADTLHMSVTEEMSPQLSLILSHPPSLLFSLYTIIEARRGEIKRHGMRVYLSFNTIENGPSSPLLTV